MKICFVYDGYENLGLGYLAAVAQKNGFQVELIPINIGDYIKGYTFPTQKKIKAETIRIRKTNADIFAFSLNSFMAGAYIVLASALRSLGCITIAGGPHATAEPELTIKSGGFDGLIIGEAEQVFAEAAYYFQNRTYSSPEWLFTPEHRRAISPQLPNINDLPFPAKDLFYRHNPFEASDYKIITSRGCPFQCIFCANSKYRNNPKFRRRSVDSVIDELEWARKKFNPKTLYFLDDVFTFHTNWLTIFLIEYKRKIGIPFHAISHPGLITEDAVMLLKSANCFKIRLGVQTLSPHARQTLGRPETNEDVIQAIELLKKHKLSVEVDHMVNLPNETLTEARKGISIYNNHRPNTIKVYWLIPLPGTIWFDQAQDRDLLSSGTALSIREGKGFRDHSYLFYTKSEYFNQKWIGIHFLLAYLPFIPQGLMNFFLKWKADRAFCIPSFFLVVGISRLFNIFRNKDRVGQEHCKRIWNKLRNK